MIFLANGPSLLNAEVGPRRRKPAHFRTLDEGHALKMTPRALKNSLYLVCLSPFFGQSATVNGQIETLLHELILGIGSESHVDCRITPDGSRGPAYYTKGTIHVHDGLLDVLGPDLGEGALCFVLAHELAHHERRHVCSNFVKKAGQNTVWAEERRTREQRMANSRAYETEADIYAGLYGHIAGFKPLGVASETLDRIYAAYDIPDSLPGYPSLEERKILAEQAQQQLTQIVKAYDVAWVALATGETAAACNLLEIIIRDAEYSSPSLFGLLALAQFMDVFKRINDPKLNTWSWPVEMKKDPSARTRGISNDEKDECFEILGKAAQNAARANQLNQGRSARELAETGSMQTGLEASIAWLTKWLVAEGKSSQYGEMHDWIDQQSQEGVWNPSIEYNLRALTFWMDDNHKKALKALNRTSEVRQQLNRDAILDLRNGLTYHPTEPCPAIEELRKESVDFFSFQAGSQKEIVVIAGKKVLTSNRPRQGVSEITIGRGPDELNFILCDMEHFDGLCWGLHEGMTLAECVDLFPNQRKTTIQLDLGQLLCLPDDRLALQFNSQGFLSFVAISLKSR